MAISDVLKKRRSELGYTLLEIANKMGVSEATVQRWESGNIKTLRQGRISLLAEILQVSPAYLMGWDDQPYPERTYGPKPIVTSDTVTLPVIGDLAAGYDAIALEDWQGDTVEIPRSYLKGRSEEEYIVLCVKGDSMYPAYRQGDKVLILRQEDVPFSGAVGAVRYEDELVTLKIVEKRIGDDGKAFIRLKPINPQYPPLEIRGEALDHYGVVGIPRLLIREVEEE